MRRNQSLTDRISAPKSAQDGPPSSLDSLALRLFINVHDPTVCGRRARPVSPPFLLASLSRPKARNSGSKFRIVYRYFIVPFHPLEGCDISETFGEGERERSARKILICNLVKNILERRWSRGSFRFDPLFIFSPISRAILPAGKEERLESGGGTSGGQRHRCPRKTTMAAT